MSRFVLFNTRMGVYRNTYPCKWTFLDNRLTSIRNWQSNAHASDCIRTLGDPFPCFTSFIADGGHSTRPLAEYSSRILDSWRVHGLLKCTQRLAKCIFFLVFIFCFAVIQFYFSFYFQVLLNFNKLSRSVNTESQITASFCFHFSRKKVWNTKCSLPVRSLEVQLMFARKTHAEIEKEHWYSSNHSYLILV